MDTKPKKFAFTKKLPPLPISAVRGRGPPATVRPPIVPTKLPPMLNQETTSKVLWSNIKGGYIDTVIYERE